MVADLRSPSVTQRRRARCPAVSYRSLASSSAGVHPTVAEFALQCVRYAKGHLTLLTKRVDHGTRSPVGRQAQPQADERFDMSPPIVVDSSETTLGRAEPIYQSGVWESRRPDPCPPSVAKTLTSAKQRDGDSDRKFRLSLLLQGFPAPYILVERVAGPGNPYSHFLCRHRAQVSRHE
ncbi:MAG: hypothetical protein JWM95_3615 [Gemmatimonadetes bacterium]|nr:hypothetical protein [Gemmatimonadota bacterium]